MSLNIDEIELLKIYIADTKQTTIENLTVALLYFKTSNKEYLYISLLNKILNMSDNDFNILKKIFT